MNGLGKLSLGAALVLAASGLLGIQTASAQDGFLFVKSTPSGARIWIDGEKTEWKTPCMVNGIKPGKHSIILKMDGHEDTATETTVRPGKINNLTLTLAKSSGPKAGKSDESDESDESEKSGEKGGVIIKTTPPGALVWVDTIKRGKTPVTVEDLSPGEHLLVADLDGYELVEKDFTVTSGKTAPLDIELVKSGAGGARAPDKTAANDPEQEDDVVPSKIDADCPYCKGSGTITSIGCEACAGTGVDLPEQCGKCAGQGRVSYQCLACEGSGQSASGKPCRYCGGKGAPPCKMCKGGGKIQRPNPLASRTPTRPCIACDGMGWEQHLRCRLCNGEGKKRAQNKARGLTVWYGNVVCIVCGGDGEGPAVCNSCSGRGYAGNPKMRVPCGKCQGTSHIFTPCSVCRGRGFLQSR